MEDSSDDEWSTTQYEESVVALQKLRDDDASGALKEFFGDSEDPREWNDGDTFRWSCGSVTAVNLFNCTKLTALPAAIGEFGALAGCSCAGFGRPQKGGGSPRDADRLAKATRR